MSAPDGTVPTGRRNPGEGGVWFFILGDMCAFALMFGILVRLQAQHSGLYEAGQSELHVEFGVANTVVLLVSSLAVALGVRAARGPDPRTATRFFLFSIGCAVLFAAFKVVEWSDLASSDASAHDSEFFLYYFTFTGLHLLHVVIGVACLYGVIRVTRGRTEPLEPGRVSLVESGASYWHMVDLLWVVLFALLYLLG